MFEGQTLSELYLIWMQDQAKIANASDIAIFFIYLIIRPERNKEYTELQHFVIIFYVLVSITFRISCSKMYYH